MESGREIKRHSKYGIWLGDIGRIARDWGFEEDPAVAKIHKQGTKLLTDIKQTPVEEVG